MKRTIRWIPVVFASAAFLAGCEQAGNPGFIPDSKGTKESRAFIENPAGIVAKARTPAKALSKDSQYPK